MNPLRELLDRLKAVEEMGKQFPTLHAQARTIESLTSDREEIAYSVSQALSQMTLMYGAVNGAVERQSELSQRIAALASRVTSLEESLRKLRATKKRTTGRKR